MGYHQNARLTIHSREQLARYVIAQGRTMVRRRTVKVSPFASADVCLDMGRTQVGVGQ